ncbi:hypothetical protein [Ancylobacter pratisalsi]|uniref:Uncharacterized protein n=1 Tax=Ancylobacter pratisalsi TaxID=1745854 RepID=A0A6P1YN93_9HYPH|nr:hypothetical protein [Ancylobacter pratisalsi]QIB34605.1 hypothetical protein G3A50_13425 [Ancylobacter pratisalsi]
MQTSDAFVISLHCDPSELADPEVRAAIADVGRQLSTAGVSPRHQVHARTGAIMASMTSLGPYLVPIAVVAIPAIAKVLIAWINAASGRKIRVRIGDNTIEANSIEQTERLIARLEELQSKGRKTGPKS